MSDATSIRIKGIRDGLLITLGDLANGTPWQLLEQELAGKVAFLRGSRVALDAGRRTIPRDELAQIRAMMAGHELELWAVLGGSPATRAAARELGLATRLPGSSTDLNGGALAVASPTAPNPEPPAPAGLLLKETIRSGRSIYHDGHVVIIGDVNPGAEIIAGGDVIVWGRLRGMVHAGALGDKTAVICALELNPTQLRLADQIAIAPDERQRQPIPETALIRDGQIVAEPWSLR